MEQFAKGQGGRAHPMIGMFSGGGYSYKGTLKVKLEIRPLKTIGTITPRVERR